MTVVAFPCVAPVVRLRFHGGGCRVEAIDEATQRRVCVSPVGEMARWLAANGYVWDWGSQGRWLRASPTQGE